MLRRVAFSKAVAAGAAGALAWELAARLMIWSGLPVFDLIRLLGTMFPGDQAPAWLWWPLGLLLHALVGAIWAIFYAYFFWSTYGWRPALQGMVFALLPIVLAGLVMVPQMGWMHPSVLDGSMPHPGVFGWRVGWGGPLGVVLGHLVYGVTLGSLYTRPIGNPTRRRRPPNFTSTAQPGPPADAVLESATSDSRFMFATGIECSYPTIDHGRWRIDELDATSHYRHWRRDLELVRELGLQYLRYGPPLHHLWVGPGKYDWSFMDEVARGMQELEIIPIMDLCHFGMPDWLGNSFQNPEFAERFAEYSAAFARRFPWVRLYTPINEMYVTARMSALEGVWNEQLQSESAFVTAVRHLARGSLLASEAITRERPDAIFVNSESGEFFQSCCPDEEIVRTADFENERRFLALDLHYGAPSSALMRSYLREHGTGENEYDWFMRAGRRIAPRCVLGVDYYEWNEKLINIQGRPESLGELFGWYVITRQYYDRYRRPLMHAETNCQDAREAPDWLWRQWHNVQLMRDTGVPVVGFTWYSLIDQVDWNIGLSKPLGNVNPVGLYDLNRDPRPVAQSYRQLLRMFGNESLVPGDAGAGLAEVIAGNRGVPSPSSYEPMDTSPARPSTR